MYLLIYSKYNIHTYLYIIHIYRYINFIMPTTLVIQLLNPFFAYEYETNVGF